ncbi:MAG: gliding motility-associated protein GldE [Bacteroidota bacterium]
MDEPPSYLLLADIISPELMFYGPAVIVLLALLFMSALVSGSEVAFFSLSIQDLDTCRERQQGTDKRILSLVNDPKRLLATILILNNFINVAIVTISTFVTWELAGGKDVGGILVVELTFVITFLIVLFGEVVPKVYATQNNLRLARLTSGMLKIASIVFNPLSKTLMSASDVVEKAYKRKGYEVSVDELNQALEITTGEETTKEEKDILKGIVNFGTLTVKQIMRSRIDITAFDLEMDFHELMDRINKSGYSRVPVYNETIDKIEGILYIKDLLPYVEEDESFKWQELLRPSFFVPETKKIDSLLKDFQEKRVHMAIIVDEYGGTSGLITLEDIIEEIVGEINDEFDDEDIAYNKLDDNTYVFEGKTSLNDFAKIIDEDPSIFETVKGESESLGGLILELNNTLPRAGEKIVFDRFVFTIVAADNKRIKRIRVFIKQKETEERAK